MRLIYLITFIVLTACGHQQNTEANLVPDHKVKVFEKNGQVLGILSSKGPVSKPNQDKYSKQNANEYEMIRAAGDVRPYGLGYPTAGLKACGEMSRWNDRAPTLSAKVVYALSEMSRDENKDCNWSQEFLGCRGVLEILKSHKNLLIPQIEIAKKIYQGCQE